MRRHIFKKLPVTFAVILAAAIFQGSPAFCRAMTDEAREMALKEHLVCFLRGDGPVESIPTSSAIYPLGEIPSVAIFSYLLFRDDPGTLESLYPRVNHLVMDRLSQGQTLDNGFMPGDGMGNSRGDILMSPFPNMLSSLELRALYLIAFASGRYEDALELRAWSRDLSKALVGAFYDHASDSFFPVSSEGYYLIAYSPEFLVPLVERGMFGEKAKSRISERLISRMADIPSMNAWKTNLDDMPSQKSIVMALLSTVDGIPCDRLKMALESQGQSREKGSEGAPPSLWVEFWDARPARCEALFPSWDCIAPLIIFSMISERESLVEEKIFPSLKEDIERVAKALSSGEADLQTHVSSIRTVNSLLARMSDFAASLESGERLWKLVDEAKWKRLSPRSKKLVISACRDAVAGLMEAKVSLTRILADGTGIEAGINPPVGPVPTGGGIDFTISLKSAKIPLDVGQVFLQASGTRWGLTDGPEQVLLGPGRDEAEWKRSLVIPPSTDPGMISVPFLLDFLCEGSRVELHMIESVTLTVGYGVSLNLPAGRKLVGPGDLPLNITIRHQAGKAIQGVVDGVFLEGITFSPVLPARFALDGARAMTELPLEIGFTEPLSPGYYPLKLMISLDGNTIASFDEMFVRPLEWLHIGPITSRRWAMEEALELQDDLSGIHISPGGNELVWRKVAAGACGQDGAVLPERLYGPGPDGCMIIYTAVSMDYPEKVRWNLESNNTVSLWINSIPVITSETVPVRQSGVTVLKKGRNTALIAAGWQSSPAPVLFSFSDEAGLPVPGLGNDIVSILETFAVSVDSAQVKGPAAPPAAQVKEVSFELIMPDASEVSVIGEFNNWAPDAGQMRKKGAGRWTVTMILPRGSYQYKFLVDRKTKITDPSNENVEPDGFGEMNSVLTVR